MDKTALENPENYSVRSYFYAYHSKYGSDQMDLKDIQVKGVEVSKDGKEVRLGLSPMQKNRVYEIQLNNFQSAVGDSLSNNLICYTINELLE